MEENVIILNMENSESKKRVVLVVEDEPALLRAISDSLKKEGLEVIEAKNGEEGLNIALDKSPDLILLDIILPKINGLELLKKLRSDARGKETPVIILTNLDDPLKVSEAMQYNVYDYFTKSNIDLSKIAE